MRPFSISRIKLIHPPMFCRYNRESRSPTVNGRGKSTRIRCASDFTSAPIPQRIAAVIPATPAKVTPRSPPQGGLLLRGKILDLSLSGCFIETLPSSSNGERTWRFFHRAPDSVPHSRNIAVFHRKRGAGVAFQNLSPRLARQIADLVQELKEICEPKQITPEDCQPEAS